MKRASLDIDLISLWILLLENKYCRYPFQIAKSMICAGEYGKDSCQVSKFSTNHKSKCHLLEALSCPCAKFKVAFLHQLVYQSFNKTFEKTIFELLCFKPG